MNADDVNDPRYLARLAWARQRANELRGFYTHLGTYLFVNLLLFVVDVVTGSGWWFYWPLLGWGIALAAHAYRVFGLSSRFGPEWEERKVRELMEEKEQ
jgi:hypothetical protein